MHHVCMEKAADDLHRRRQDSDLENTSFDRTNIAAVTEPKDVIEHMVRVSCDRLDEWRFGVRSLECQNETAEITLPNTVDRTRRVKTIPRNSTRYSHFCLGHCEEVEKQIRAFIFPRIKSRRQMRPRQTCCMDFYTMHSQR